MLNELYSKAQTCKACLLYKTRNNIVFSDGFEFAPVMFIGEAPGENEDKTGIPFIGRAGQLLRKFFPIFHPSYLLRYHSLEEGSPRYLFKQDLLKIKEIINKQKHYN